jgi:hypothetical protein
MLAPLARVLGARTDERGASNRVIRGGNFNDTTTNLLPPNRNDNTPTNRNNDIGFRCAKTVVSSCMPGRSESRRFHGRRERGDPQSTPFVRVIARTSNARSRTVLPAHAVGSPFPEPPLPIMGTRPGTGLARVRRRAEKAPFRRASVCGRDAHGRARLESAR